MLNTFKRTIKIYLHYNNYYYGKKKHLLVFNRFLFFALLYMQTQMKIHNKVSLKITPKKLLFVFCIKKCNKKRNIKKNFYLFIINIIILLLLIY